MSELEQWTEIEQRLEIVDEALAEIDTLEVLPEYARVGGKLNLLQERTTLLLKAECLCENHADRQLYQAAVRASIEQETVLRAKLATLEQVLTERQSAVLH
jgi:hypothetical protein